MTCSRVDKGNYENAFGVKWQKEVELYGSEEAAEALSTLCTQANRVVTDFTAFPNADQTERVLTSVPLEVRPRRGKALFLCALQCADMPPCQAFLADPRGTAGVDMVAGATIQRLAGTRFAPLMAEAIGDGHVAVSFKESINVADILTNPIRRAALSEKVVSLLEMCVDKNTGNMLSNRFADAFWRLVTSGTGPHRAAPGGYAADSSGTGNGGGGIYVAQHLKARLNLCLSEIVYYQVRTNLSAFRPPGVPQGCC